MIAWRQNAPARAHIPPSMPEPAPVVPVERPKLVLVPAPLPLPGVSLRAIQDAVAAQYGIDRNEMLSGSRRDCLTHPRQLAMYLSRKLTDGSYPEIGRAFGRHHTSALHAEKTVQSRLAQSAKLRADFDAILEALGE